MPGYGIVEGSVACMARRLESGIWLGQCEALGIFLEADDLEDLHEQFRDAFRLTVQDMVEEGEVETLVKALAEASGNDWKPPKIQGRGRAVAAGYASAVPWHMIAEGQPGAFTQEVA